VLLVRFHGRDSALGDVAVQKRLRKQIRQRLSRLSFLLQSVWRRPGQAEPLAAQYSDTVRSRLKAAKHTASLGSNLRGEEYEDLGKSFFAKLREYGLRPDDVCVDYGCGTLRVGRHLIKYLRPGAYWGLDIDQYLLDEGRNLLGEAEWAEKRPNLRVISPQTVAEAAAARPAMLFSAKVLSHVHPDDVPGFISNLLTIIGSSGQAIVMSRWTDQATFQANKWMWAHSIAGLSELVASQGGALAVLAEKEGIGKGMRSGTFRIVQDAKVTPGNPGETAR
jgi:SAM-dependent methyltransferase